MDARISKAIMRSGTVFCCLIFLYWAVVALMGREVPSVGVLPMLPGLEFVLPWEVSRWFDPLGAFAMICVVAMVCGSSLVSEYRPAASLGAGIGGGIATGAGIVPDCGLIGAMCVTGIVGGCCAFGVAISTAKRTERASHCMETALAYGIGSGIVAGVMVSVSLGTVVGAVCALLMLTASLAAGGFCLMLLNIASVTPSASRRTFRWLSGN